MKSSSKMLYNLDWYLDALPGIQEQFKITKKVNYLKDSSLELYKNYLKALDEHNNGKTIKWIEEAHAQSNNPKDKVHFELPVEDIVEAKFDNYVNGLEKIDIYDVGDISSALKLLTKSYLSIFDGVYSVLYNRYIEDEALAKMIAETAIFVPRDVVREAVEGGINYPDNNEYASADNCTHRRKRHNEKKGDKDSHDPNVILDDNTHPNLQIKRAICIGMNIPLSKTSLFKNYVVCHIWGEPYDKRAFCSLVNLVLIPKAIYGLTDHHDFIKRILQKRSIELFKKIKGLIFPPYKNYKPGERYIEPSFTKEEKIIYDNLNWRPDFIFTNSSTTKKKITNNRTSKTKK